ncbi:serine/threonine protein kinase [candidate division KSB1 bacterium]|nr:serine/threonine protein kinase [candidate division KSB1 bacterium]MBL7092781.1 serine/threonine protein kinase [candidate division KSB1 bacterium]
MLIGKNISHYKILEKLGEGGMGIVYKAFDTKLERTVALKLLRPETIGDPDAKKRFIREAKAASALNHPNITTIYEVDEWHGRDFISMEFVEGKTIREKVKSAQLTFDEVLNIAEQLAGALQEAHEHNIVHRDIKSENIMVTLKGQVKVMDFGLAKLKGMATVTKTGTTIGTVAYMSPEQAQGIDQGSGRKMRFTKENLKRCLNSRFKEKKKNRYSRCFSTLCCYRGCFVAKYSSKQGAGIVREPHCRYNL